MESFSEYTDKNIVRRFYKFNYISNSTDAYLIGYLSCDGNYSEQKKNGKLYPKMGVTSTDKYIVESFQKTYCPDQSILYREPRSSLKVNATKSTADLWFPKKMETTFKKFGIYTEKSKRRLIGIPKEYMSSYTLGVMDADGCFVVRHRKDCRTPRLNIHIVSSAVDLLLDIQKHLELNLNIASSIYNRKSSKCSELRINNTVSAIKFGEWIYSKLPNTYNYKKHSIFKNYYAGLNLGELLEQKKFSISSEALNVKDINLPELRNVQRLVLREINNEHKRPA